MRARPLHRYTVMGYQIVASQQMDLHLLRFSGKLLLKPLPDYIFSYSFWQNYICPDMQLWKNANGWLLSYIWILVSPLDFQIAKDAHLLPEHLTWANWKSFVEEFCGKIDIEALDQVNPRFQFGDLRLYRINTIYRTLFFTTHFVRGYLYTYNRYVVFFERNFSWILIAFVFFSLVLSAMQVGLAVSPLAEDQVFREVSWGFVVFSMMVVATALGSVGVVFAGVFLFNMGAAIGDFRGQRRRREALVGERRGGLKV